MIVHKVIVNYIPEYCSNCPINDSPFSGIHKVNECGKEEQRLTGKHFTRKVPDHRCLLEKVK